MSIKSDLLDLVTLTPGHGVSYYARVTGLRRKQVSRTLWGLKNDGHISSRGPRKNTTYYIQSEEVDDVLVRYPRPGTDRWTMLQHMLKTPSRYSYIPTLTQQLAWPRKKASAAVIGLMNNGLLIKHPQDRRKSRGCRYRPTSAVAASDYFRPDNDQKPPTVPAPPPKRVTQPTHNSPDPVVVVSADPPTAKDSTILALEAQRDKMIEEAEAILSKATALGDAIEVLRGILNG